MSNDRYNGSHYTDLTAYHAINSIEEEKRVNKLVSTIFYIAHLAGYEVEGRITLKNKRTGKIWR